ncbi:MAG: hypothetical protein JST80_05615 [Bdellovibrionales bacterium]|nr:hypothetical protein [Bdellovibrionales bacterium]
MKKLHSRYDFVFFGEHPAALWGTVCALDAGFQVLVVPFGATISKTVVPKFAAVTLGLEKSKQTDPIQILTPDRRFRIGETHEDWNAEHEFCFSRPIDGMMGPRADILRGFAYLYRGAETGPSVSQPWSEVAGRVSNTQFIANFGSDLKKKCFDLITKKGGTVLAEQSLAQIFVERKKLIGVQLHAHSDVIPVDQGIFSAPIQLLQPLLNVDGRNEILKLKSRPLSWRFEIQVQVNEGALPPGLTTRMIYVQKDAPIVDILHLVNEGKPGRFRLRVDLPFDDASLKRSEQRKIAQRLVRLMSELIPDFSYNVSQVVPEIRDPEHTERDELPKLYPFHTLEEIPLGLLTYGVPGVGWKTPIQGLSLAGDETEPALGEWGAYRSIQSIFQNWLKRAEKTEQPKRKPLVDLIAQSVKI